MCLFHTIKIYFIYLSFVPSDTHTPNLCVSMPQIRTYLYRFRYNLVCFYIHLLVFCWLSDKIMIFGWISKLSHNPKKVMKKQLLLMFEWFVIMGKDHVRRPRALFSLIVVARGYFIFFLFVKKMLILLNLESCKLCIFFLLSKEVHLTKQYTNFFYYQQKQWCWNWSRSTILNVYPLTNFTT